MEQSPSAKSRWRLFVEWGIVPLVIGLILAGLALYRDRADAATQDRTEIAQRVCVPPEPTMTCEEWADKYKDRKVKQWRAGKLGNADGYRLPRKWRRAFNRWARNHPAANARLAARGEGHWWMWPLESWGCTPIAGLGYKANCHNAEEHHRVYVKKSTEIVVTCSGVAAVGALAGGGAVGVAKGAAGCLWGHIAYALLGLDFFD